jgi:hypothetical protein
MDKKLKMKIDGPSKVDINSIDLSAQARMFSGGVDNHTVQPVLTKEEYEKILNIYTPTSLIEEKGKK